MGVAVGGKGVDVDVGSKGVGVGGMGVDVGRAAVGRAVAAGAESATFDWQAVARKNSDANIQHTIINCTRSFRFIIILPRRNYLLGQKRESSFQTGESMPDVCGRVFQRHPPG